MNLIVRHAAPAKRGQDYTADDVQVLGHIEGMRKRPAQYLGSSDSSAITHMIREAIDNAIDEFNAGRNDYVAVTVTQKMVQVVDHGGGIPVEKHKATGRPVIQDVFLEAHAGGKFGSKAYESGSIGTHGIGMTAVNALSTYMQVWTFRNKKWWSVQFSKGKLVKPLHAASPPVKAERGTIVRFTPDFSCFIKGSGVDYEKLQNYMELLGFLNSGCKIGLVLPEKKQSFNYTQTGGLKALLDREITRTESVSILKNPILLDEKNIHLAMTWVDGVDENVLSYVNSASTPDGGTHVRGLNEAMSEALKPYKGTREFSAADLRAGMFAILNVNMPEPKFSSQTKEKLVSEDATAAVHGILLPALEKFFAANKTIAAEVVKRAEQLKKLREKSAADRKALKEINSGRARVSAAGKLAAARTKDIDRIELFLVEGDSAGGTAKKARNIEIHSVLPMRGKVLNSYKNADFLKNEVVQNILWAVGGVDNDGNYNHKNRKCGKVVLLADPDVDGKHITLLVLSLIQKMMPQMIAEGRVFVVAGSLFKATYKNKMIFGDTVEDVLRQIPNGAVPKDGVQHIKGWGEVDEYVLGPVAFEPATRKLLRVAPLRQGEENQFIALVGEGASERRKLLGL